MGSINMGGISFSKNFRLDPYYIYRPTLNIEGTVKNRATMEVYLDGVLIRTEEIPAGQYEIRDLYYYQGQRDVEILIKDTYGNIERQIYPFYFTENILRKGEWDYSYNLGFVRENFGIESSSYGDSVFSFYHKYGYSNSLNFGISSEFWKDSITIAPEMAYYRSKLGTLSFKSYLNDNKNADGINYSLIFNYNYQLSRVSYNFYFKNLSKDFATFNFDNKKSNIRYEINGGISYYSQSLGSFSFNLLHKNLYENSSKNELYFNYSKSLLKKVSLSVNTRTVLSGGSLFESFINISYHFDKDRSMFLRHQDADQIKSNSLQISKNAPVGEGYGYRLTAENRSLNGGNSYNAINPYFEYRTRYNIFTGNLNLEKNNNFIDLTASGAIIYIADNIGFSRPINDSFSLIKVDSMKDITVIANNEKISKTDQNGKAVIPNLSSYIDNTITIPIENLPLEYSFPNNKLVLSPPFRYGACINLPLKKIYRYEGFIKIKQAGQVRPLDFREIKFSQLKTKKADKTASKGCKTPLGEYREIAEGSFFTSQQGDFYLENVLPGSYEIEFVYNNRIIKSVIELEDKKDVIIELGEIIINVD